MIIKNFSRLKTSEIMKLANFVIEKFPSLDHAGVEVHVKQYNGRGYLGISFPTTIRSEVVKKYQHCIKNIEPESKQFAIVYVRKDISKAKQDVQSWQEDFVSTLVHELRHLWHWRNKKGLDEEQDCIRMEQEVIKKYRKSCNELPNNLFNNCTIGQLVKITPDLAL